MITFLEDAYEFPTAYSLSTMTALIEAVFGPVPGNTDLIANARPGNDTSTIILLLIATISVVLRIFSRKASRAGITADDYMMVTALVSALSACMSSESLFA